MRALLVLVAVVSACGFEQSNAIDVPHVEGRPVKLANVRMAESLYATLATGPTKMSSGMEANAIGIAYEIEIVEPAPQYAGVVAQLACHFFYFCIYQ